MTLRDRVRALLDTLDGVGVDPAALAANSHGADLVMAVGLRSCGDYEAVCRALKADPGKPRTSSRGNHRVRDVVTRDGVLIEHRCWPHLDCWGQP